MKMELKIRGRKCSYEPNFYYGKFTEDWGNMNGKEISEVLIMTHGKNQSILVGDGQQFTATGNGKTNISYGPAPNIQDLPQPRGNIDKAMLYMYSCHSADMNPYAHGKGDHRQGPLLGTKHPIAYVMAQKFKFYGVRGTAESVNYHSFGLTLHYLHLKTV